MTHTIDLKRSQFKGLRQFQEFTFIGNSRNSSTESQKISIEQLNLSPDSKLLSTISEGNFILITKILTAKNITRQLRDLQFKPGQTVELISTTNNGSVVVSLGDKLIGIGAEIAQKIIVTVTSGARK